MEDTINIAGVNCKVSKLATLNYESLYRLALNSNFAKGYKRRLELIDKALKEHGFKPTESKVKTNNSRKSKRGISKRNKD
jgi:hypothetical protein